MAVGQKQFKKARYVAEATYGAGAASNKMQEMRFDDVSFSFTENRSQSAEITGTRGIKEHHRTKESATLSLSTPLFYGTQTDDWLMYSLSASAWSSLVTNTDTTYSMANSDNSINDSGSQFVVDGFVANQWVYISGFTTAANNGWAKIVSVAAGKMVLSHITVSDEAAGDTVTIAMGAQLTDGTTINDFALEVERSGMGSNFTEIKGLVVNGMTVTCDDDGVVTIGYDCVGQDINNSSSTYGDGSPTAAATTNIIKSNAGCTFLHENGSSAEGIRFNFSLTNNVNSRFEIGTEGPTGQGLGAVEVSGSYEALYENYALFDKYIDETATDFALALEDSAGNRYLMEIIDVDLTGWDESEQDNDTVQNVSFVAAEDASESKTIRIVKIAA